MRLSDVKGERTLEVVAELVGPIASLAASKDVQELMTPKRKPKGMTAEQFMLGRIKDALPGIIRSHRSDIIAILAAVGDKTPEEYAQNMTLPSLLSDVMDLITDDAFTAFLASPSTTGADGQST